MMNIKIEMSDYDVKQIIIDYIKLKLGETNFDSQRLKTLVKTSKNYKAEYEEGVFKVLYDGEI